ncbi:MAG: hypothetical protein HY674_07895 [Chloroflexi bacterium]|nr:hypothetical protein [Chloroflexota bacterium]
MKLCFQLGGFFLVAILLAGCVGAHRRGISRHDEFEAVKVDQMTGNNVSGRVFQKTIVCLNARRETRRITAITNVNVLAVTNRTIQAFTNETVSMATNFLVATMTNLASPPSPLSGTGPAAGEGAAAAPGETSPVLVVTNAGPSVTTNLTVSVASNQSATAAPNQTASNSQIIRTYNNQITTTSNNVSISLLTNQVITAETNQAVSYATNYHVAWITNLVVSPTNLLAHDYCLYTELIPPSDFTLQSGESLVLLVDGTRYGFTQSTLTAALMPRKGFTPGLYRVPPEVLLAIANAQEVKVRFKGVNSDIERTMSAGSKKNFRSFLLKYFAPDPAEEAPEDAGAMIGQSGQVATR